jgi:hypothetical protein
MSSATGYGDREETHADESEGEAARINLNGFGEAGSYEERELSGPVLHWIRP